MNAKRDVTHKSRQLPFLYRYQEKKSYDQVYGGFPNCFQLSVKHISSTYHTYQGNLIEMNKAAGHELYSSLGFCIVIVQPYFSQRPATNLPNVEQVHAICAHLVPYLGNAKQWSLMENVRCVVVPNRISPLL
ncbi:uncharacterized protein LOC144422707 [Styela clava]